MNKAANAGRGMEVLDGFGRIRMSPRLSGMLWTSRVNRWRFLCRILDSSGQPLPAGHGSEAVGFVRRKGVRFRASEGRTISGVGSGRIRASEGRTISGVGNGRIRASEGRVISRVGKRWNSGVGNGRIQRPKNTDLLRRPSSNLRRPFLPTRPALSGASVRAGWRRSGRASLLR